MCKIMKEYIFRLDIALMLLGEKKVFYKIINSNEERENTLDEVRVHQGWFNLNRCAYISCECDAKKDDDKVHYIMFSKDNEIFDTFKKWKFNTHQTATFIGEICEIPECCLNKFIEINYSLVNMEKNILKEIKEQNINNFSIKSKKEGVAHSPYIFHVPCSNTCKISLERMKINKEKNDTLMKQICKKFNYDYEEVGEKHV